MRAALTYWGTAFLVALSVRWPELWAIIIAIALKEVWRLHKIKKARTTEQRLPVQVVPSAKVEATHPAVQHIDAPTPKPEETTPPPVPLADGQIYDPFVALNEVYQYTIDWQRYEVPTVMRKQLALSETKTTGPVFEELPAPTTPAVAAEQKEDVGNFVYC